MIKRLLSILCIVFALVSKTKAQCPQIIDFLGNPTSTPLFKSCTGGAYTLNFQATTNFGAYTINWGDATPNTTGASYTANSIIPHVYAAGTNYYTLTLSIPANNCTITASVIMEQAAVATISLTTIGATQCAPKTFTFINITNNQTPSTTYTWTWGDGSPNQIFNAATNPSIITHTFQKNTVQNCATTVFLYANNTCNFVPSFDQKGPFQIYDTDPATVSPDAVTKCFPDVTFTFNNTTLRQCLPQGNTAQRYEYWNLGDHWGKGVDSIVDWKPWPPTTPRTVTYPGLGSYTVQLLDSNACGISSITTVVNVVYPPTASMLCPSGNICQNTPVTFTNTSPAGSYQYLWNFGTGNGFTNLGPGNKSTTYGTPGTYTVKLIVAVAGSSSCRDTAICVVNIIAAPVSNFSYSPTTGCNSVTTTFTETSVGGVSWAWNFGNSNTFSGQNPPSQNYTSPGTYTVSLVVTGSTTCVHTKTAAIIVRSTPVPNFPQFANCVFAVSNFTSTSTVGGTVAITSYTWDFGDGTPRSNSITPAHTYTAPNTYSVKLIAATPFCVDSVVKTIVINLKPVANFAFTPTINCPPFVTTFSNTTLNGINYLWRFGAIPNVTSNVTSPTFTYNNTTQNNQSYTVTLVALTGAGCADSIKKVISVFPKPIANYTSQINSGCAPIAINFSNTSTGANTFSWTLGDGATSTQSLVSHTFSNTGLTQVIYTVQLIVANANGCMDTVEKVVFINPSPSPSFSISPGSGCGPLEVNFSAALGAISYTWDYGDGSPISNAINPPHTYTNTGLADQVFTISLGITNAYLCTNSVAATATVFGKPIASFSLNPGVGCSPLAVTYTNGSTDNATNLWRFGNGLTSVLADPTTVFTNSPGDPQQAFTTKLIVANAKNCKDSTNLGITLLAQPSSSFTPDTPACSPKVIKFTNQSSANATSYAWNFGNGNVSTAGSPEVLYSNATATNVVYMVTLTSKTNDGCTSAYTIPVTIYAKPNFFVNASPDSGCSPLRVKFIKNATAVKHRFDFERDGSFTDPTNVDVNFSFVNTTGFDKTFETVMIAEDVHGCLDTANKFFKVFPNPTAKFTARPLEVYIPNQATNFSNASVLGKKFLWDFGDGATSSEESPSHTYTKPGEYQISLTVETIRGCKDVYILPEKVKALDETSVQMPNAFSPNPAGSPGRRYDNKDINNDIFHPLIQGTEKYVFSIYSRWGELLFETTDENEGWDGYYKGKLCTQDVYVWKIGATFRDGKTYNKTGDLLLLRTDQ